METWIGLLLIFLAGGYLYLESKEKQKAQRKVRIRKTYNSKKSQISKSKPITYTPMTHNEITAEAKRIASTVKTRDELQLLEDKISALENELFQYQKNNNETMYSRTVEKQRMYEYARDYAWDNPFMYYYNGGYPRIDMPLSVLKNAGRLISVNEYNQLEESLKSYYKVIALSEIKTKDEAQEIASDAVLLCNKEINDIISLKDITESDLSEEEREKQFNELVSSSQFLMDELDLHDDNELSLYQQYENRIINERVKALDSMPHALILVNNGIETLEDINALSDKELLALNNIGPKRLADIREYLNTIS